MSHFDLKIWIKFFFRQWFNFFWSKWPIFSSVHEAKKLRIEKIDLIEELRLIELRIEKIEKIDFDLKIWVKF